MVGVDQKEDETEAKHMPVHEPRHNFTPYNTNSITRAPFVTMPGAEKLGDTGYHYRVLTRNDKGKVRAIDDTQVKKYREAIEILAESDLPHFSSDNPNEINNVIKVKHKKEWLRMDYERQHFDGNRPNFRRIRFQPGHNVFGGIWVPVGPKIGKLTLLDAFDKWSDIRLLDKRDQNVYIIILAPSGYESKKVDNIQEQLSDDGFKPEKTASGKTKSKNQKKKTSKKK